MRMVAFSVSVLCGLTAGFVRLPCAHADSLIDLVAANAQCAFQYPADEVFQEGSAYVVAPGDAYSWRCQRVAKTPGGGAIADLGVDLANFCARRGATAAINDAGNAYSWSCRNAS